MGTSHALAYADRQLLALSDAVSELGNGVGGVAAGHRAAAYGTRAAVTGDDYGQAFWKAQGETFEAIGELLRLISKRCHSEGENLCYAKAAYDRASMLPGVR